MAGAHQVIELGVDVGMGGEIVPEGEAEDFVVGGSAGADGGEKRGPGVGHAAAETIEIEADAGAGREELAGGVIEFEMAGGGFEEDSLGDEMAEDAVEGFGVGSGGGGEVCNFGVAGVEVFGDAESDGDVEGPGGGEVR